MPKGEHLKHPVITGAEAIIKVSVFTREGRLALSFGVKDYMGNTSVQGRKTLIREALESKLGKLLYELPGGG